MENNTLYNALYDFRKYPQEDKEYFYPIFLETLNSINKKVENTPYFLLNNNNFALVLDYLVHEHYSALAMIKEEYIETLKHSDVYKKRLVLIVTDKIFVNEYINYKPIPLITRFDSIISTPKFVLNFALNQLVEMSERKLFIDRVLFDAYKKAFLLANSIFELLVDGAETEAFSTWRTMHEMECVIKVLYEHQYLGDTYFLHIKYNSAFRNEIEDKDEQARLINEIKEKLKLHNLKIKDLKKYIEYGWIYEIKDQETVLPDFKLNFRKGLEYAAGLSAFSNIYEMSSEIAHSSPLLIYSKKDYFKDITILSVYGTFIRLEEIFFNLLKKQGDIDVSGYESMRKDYVEEMKRIFLKLTEDYQEKYAITNELEAQKEEDTKE